MTSQITWKCLKQRCSNQFRKCPTYDFQVRKCNGRVKNANSKSNVNTKIGNKKVSSVLRHNRSNSDFWINYKRIVPLLRSLRDICSRKYRD